jgi:hypothetical protein
VVQEVGDDLGRCGAEAGTACPEEVLHQQGCREAQAADPGQPVAAGDISTALLLALNDLIDEEAGVAGLAATLLAETDPPQLIAQGVHLTRQLNERCGDLIRVLLSAEPAEPAAAAAVADGMRRHDHGASRLAQRLAALGALRVGTTPERATAVLSMMTSAANWRQLTQQAGWTFDEAEAWLAASLAQLLLEQNR